MTFLLNFVHFEAIFAYSETILLILNLILLILKQKSPTDVVEELPLMRAISRFNARIWDGGLNNAVEKTQIKFVFLLAYSYLCSTINHKC